VSGIIGFNKPSTGNDKKLKQERQKAIVETYGAKNVSSSY
jgi:hypothetical protein